MKIHFINIFNYEIWANNEIAESLAGVEVVPEKAISLMSHIINAQSIWLGRLKNETPDVKVWQEYDKDEITGKLKVTSGKLLEFLNSLSDNDIRKEISYANSKGEKFESAMSDILIHMSHHSAYHRGQIVMLIKPLVSELPITDYIHFTRKIKN